MKYVIKSVPSDNTTALENLLNDMSAAGWDLYSMHEVEVEEGYQYNCIFATDELFEDDEEQEDVVNITMFKSQMEKMFSSSASPYDSCKEIQEKIKEQRKKIVKIKSQLEAQLEAPVSKNRQHLNEEISKGLKNLDELRQNLIKAISPEAMYSKVRQEKLSICLSEEAVDLVNPDLGGVLIAETVKIRQKLAEELGYVVPKIIFEDEELHPYEFSIKIRGLEVIRSYVYPNHRMFFVDDLKMDKNSKGIRASVDEVTGRKIVWLEEKKTKDFWQNGISAAEFVARLLEYVVINNIDELLDYSDINQYMEIVGEKSLFLIENIIPDFVTVSELRYLLANLLREEVSIKDIVYVFEKINDFSDQASKEDLYDKLRLSFSRYISKKVSNSEGVIQVFNLSDKTYKNLFAKLASEDDIVRIDGAKAEQAINSLLRKAKINGVEPVNIVILAPIEIRHMLFMVMSQFVSKIKVIAREEIANEYTVEIVDEF